MKTNHDVTILLCAIFQFVLWPPHGFALENQSRPDDTSAEASRVMVPRIRELIEILGHGRDKQEQVDAAKDELIRIGKPAIPFLLKTLPLNLTLEHKFRSANCFGVLSAMPDLDEYDLSDMLDEEDLEAKKSILLLIRKLGTRATPFISYLIRQLGNDDSYVRAYAASALGSIGPPAKVALPQLIAMRDKVGSDAGFYEILPGIDANGAIARINNVLEPKGIEFYRFCLATRLKNAGTIRIHVFISCGRLGSLANEMVSDIVQFTSKDYGDGIIDSIRVAAVDSLGEIGPAAAPAVPVLEGFQEDDLLKYVCASSLTRITKNDDSVEQRWIDLMFECVQTRAQDPKKLVRGISSVIVTLGDLGPRAEPALPALEAIANDQYSRTFRNLAKEAIEKLKAKPAGTD